MGWGATSYGGSTSNELLKGYLMLVNSTVCNKSFEDDTDNLPKGIVESQICAGDSTRLRDTWWGWFMNMLINF